MQASPVKQEAVAAGIPVFQPESCKTGEALDLLRSLAPDLLIVVAYGQILPQAILDLPTRGAINVHASLLPAWRGAAPIARAIAAGDKESGVAIMQMEAGLDSGPVLWEERVPIAPDDKARLTQIFGEGFGCRDPGRGGAASPCAGLWRGSGRIGSNPCPRTPRSRPMPAS